MTKAVEGWEFARMGRWPTPIPPTSRRPATRRWRRGGGSRRGRRSTPRLRDSETASAAFGLAAALWWLGESQASVDSSTRAYALFRRADDIEGAVRSATWLGITYKSNFSNFAAANGWIGRAERLLQPLEVGPLHAWAWVARAYQMPDLDTAAELTERALGVARECRRRRPRARGALTSSDASGSPWATTRKASR